jgi:IS5 family transposase
MERLQFMLRKNPEDSGQEELFRSRLESIIDPSHELVRLSRIIDWEGLEAAFSGYYCADSGRPGGSIRLMAGLIFLKESKGLSDEELCAVWRENPYFQYFCGETYFQHRFPVEPPSIGNFRRRIGEAGMERLLQETIRAGLRSGAVERGDLERVVVDTTVQEKAVRHPTDTQLCEKARGELVDLARKNGIDLRQSYARKGRNAAFMANRYMAARQTGRGRKMIKCVRNYLGRVMRDIERAIATDPSLEATFAESLEKSRIVFNQTLQPKAAEKLYSWHAPEVECIAKGKAHKKYEFGCKASFASTNKSNFIVGAQALHGKPFDGHTLAGALVQIEKLTSVRPKEAAVDRGYRGHGLEGGDTAIIIAGRKRGLGPAARKRLKRRNAIEPIIGHCKNDRKTGPRNWLKGKIGDKINAIAIAVGFNIRKILRILLLCLLKILAQLQLKPDLV